MKNIPIDHPGWKRVVAALMKSGLTQHEIERISGVDQSVLSCLLNRKRASVRFDNGIRLFGLYVTRVLKRGIIEVRAQ
jgi:hypothetical protein